MASSKERLRWERMHADLTARNERQYAAITRLSVMMIEARAALEEIASDEAHEEYEGDQARARRALDTLDKLARNGNEPDEEGSQEAQQSKGDEHNAESDG